MNFVDSFVAFASKIGSQRHLAAIRDSFATTIPILIAGALATLINAIPGIINSVIIQLQYGGKEPEGFQGVALPSYITSLDGNIWWGTFGMVTLFIVVLLAYNLASSYEANPLAAVVVSLCCYMSLVPQAWGDAGWGNIHYSFTNSTSLLAGMLITICATEIYVRLSRNKSFDIKMPDGVPPAVARSFSALIPGTVTIFVVVGFFHAVYYLSSPEDAAVRQTIFELILTFVMAPLRTVSDTIWAAIAVVIFSHVMWIFGLHGSNMIEGIVQTVYTPAIEMNSLAAMDGITPPYIITKPFIDCFVYIGGSGATLGLLIAMFLVGKSKSIRYMSNLAIGPGAFNINEPVIFGLPIVLNPVFAIPFIIAPVVTTIVSYFATLWGLVGRTVVMVHWATPPILSGFLVTGGDFRASLLQIVNIAISFAIYLPFVLIADKMEIAKEIK